MQATRAAYTPDRRVTLLLVAGLLVAFAALLWPSAADAQRRLRNPCLDPKRTLNVQQVGGAATFTAREPLENCVSPTSGVSFTTQQTCTFHCQHWHTWVKTGVPFEPNVQLSAVPAAGTYLLGWGNCTPTLGQARADCTVRVRKSLASTTVAAYLGPAPDTTPPSPLAITSVTPSSYSAVVRWSASSDQFLAGYDVYRSGRLEPVARVAPGGTSTTVRDLFCRSSYMFRVEAFDTSGNVVSSAEFPATTGRCGPTTPPNTQMHVGPARRTKSRSAYFHWGANRTRVTYQCKLDRRAWARCRPGKRYRNLRKGAHVFRVRARDQGGTDRTPAIYRWRIV